MSTFECLNESLIHVYCVLFVTQHSDIESESHPLCNIFDTDGVVNRNPRLHSKHVTTFNPYVSSYRSIHIDILSVHMQLILFLIVIESNDGYKRQW